MGDAPGPAEPGRLPHQNRQGRGHPGKGNHETHGKALGAAEIAATRQKLGWGPEPFAIPDAIVEAWRKAGRKAARTHRKWARRLKGSDARAAFEAAMSGDVPAAAFEALDAHIAKALADKPANATRAHSGAALEALVTLTPEIDRRLGRPHRLQHTPWSRAWGWFDAPDYAGRYVNYGVREFGMAAAMNGMALHGGVIPYGGTFLCSPTMRGRRSGWRP